jgi:LmbE family N-acetylglucosaminyl deacetylase
MEFIDFRAGRRSGRIETIFPGWRPGEAVAFLSPHDDDVVLGAGYLLQAVAAQGGLPHVVVFCRGDAGYTRRRDRRTIVRTRRAEAVAAYGTLGVAPSRLHFFGLPDLSLMGYVDRKAFGRGGVPDRLIRLLRRHRVGRVVFASPNFENWDHTAVFNLGMYCAPQAGDPILADLGRPHPVLSLLVYAVWGDFGPGLSAPASPGSLRADAGILAGDAEEKRIGRAQAAFASQAAVIANTAARQRSSRRGPDGYLELYQSAVVREPVDYAPYFARLKELSRPASGRSRASGTKRR